MATLQKIAPCLWFDDQAEQAVKFYTSLFPNSGIDYVARYGKAGFEQHGRPEGSVMTVDFRLAGLRFTALNGGPIFKFSEAISLQVFCDNQAELDRMWDGLLDKGEPTQCGWLKDQFGLSWQVVPTQMNEWMTASDQAKSQRVMQALMQMQKLDIATLERAFRG